MKNKDTREKPNLDNLFNGYKNIMEETREKTAEEYLDYMITCGTIKTSTVTVSIAKEYARLSKIEALEESHNKISALSSLAHISDAQAILYKQITQLKNGK